MGRLGAPTSFAGCLSEDRFGQRLADGLRQSNVDVVGPISALPTTLAAAELDAGGAASYRFYITDTSAPAVSTVEVPQDLAVLHVGTLGLVLDPMASAAAAAVDSCSESTIVFCDPNCRPRIVGDAHAYRELLSRVLKRADVVKFSADDLEYLVPGVAPTDAARQLVDTSDTLVLVTDGGDAVHSFGPFGHVVTPTPTVDVVDTVGAGDAFGGGFCAWWVHRGYGRAELADGSLVRSAVEYAVRVAALTCVRQGADPPWQHEM